MYLDLDPLKMKLVYELRTELQNDPRQVKLTQALTLDKSKPRLGLTAKGGLFGSDEWWDSTRNGRIPVRAVSGVIVSTQFAGQDARWGDEVNEFRLKLDDGSEILESVYVNQRRDAVLFKPGRRVMFAIAFLETKASPGVGLPRVCETILEMAVSLAPET